MSSLDDAGSGVFGHRSDQRFLSEFERGKSNASLGDVFMTVFGGKLGSPPSPWYFSRLFRQSHDTSPKTWLQQQSNDSHVLLSYRPSLICLAIVMQHEIEFKTLPGLETIQ